MMVEIASIPDVGLTLNAECPVTEFHSKSGDIKSIAPAVAELKLERDGSRVDIKGRIRTTAKMVCSRCFSTDK